MIELTGKLEAETRKVGERDRTPQEEEHAIGTKKLVKKVVEDNDRQAHDVISIGFNNQPIVNLVTLLTLH